MSKQQGTYPTLFNKQTIYKYTTKSNVTHDLKLVKNTGIFKEIDVDEHKIDMESKFDTRLTSDDYNNNKYKKIKDQYDKNNPEFNKYITGIFILSELFGKMCSSDREFNVSQVGDTYIEGIMIKTFINSSYTGVNNNIDNTNESDYNFVFILHDNNILNLLIYKYGCKEYENVTKQKAVQLTVICQDATTRGRLGSTSLFIELIKTFIAESINNGMPHIILEAASSFYNKGDDYGSGASLHLLCIYESLGFEEMPDLARKYKCFDHNYQYNSMIYKGSSVDPTKKIGKICKYKKILENMYSIIRKNNTDISKIDQKTLDNIGHGSDPNTVIFIDYKGSYTIQDFINDINNIRGNNRTRLAHGKDNITKSIKKLLSELTQYNTSYEKKHKLADNDDRFQALALCVNCGKHKQPDTNTRLTRGHLQSQQATQKRKHQDIDQNVDQNSNKTRPKRITSPIKRYKL